MSKSKNDIAWEKIFEKYCILDKLANNERISISSTEINQFREARLMTKFDHRSQLPKLFIDHNLSILPTSRGTYEIGTFKTFCDFNKDDIEITPIDFPTFLESIDYKDITSESIRQLYYPYRLWSNKIRKRVRPIFLTYSNGIFHLREYEFATPELYNSIRLIQHKKYAVQEGGINVENIQNILDSIQVVKEPELPFPQADSFERVINLCELLKQKGFICKDDITQNYDFDHRQTDYYSNAAKYLGLAEVVRENQQIGCILTREGSRIFNLPIIERQLEFVKLILAHTAFQNTLKLYFDKGNAPTRDEVVEIMKNAKLYNIDSEQTYRRRASTVISWINWILELIE